MKKIQKDGLIYLQSDVIAAPHLFSTRKGGVSKGCFAELNTSFTVGDDEENVRENLSKIADAVGFDISDIVCSNQVHSDAVRKVSSSDKGVGIFSPKFASPADALITDEKGVLLLVRSADCTPILLFDEKRHAVAAIHSGWRGTLSDIIGKTVMAMSAEYGTAPEDICAAIGPCISCDSFEVGADVAKAFLDAGYGDFIDESREKPHIDLVGICEKELESAGVCRIDIANECTVKNSDLYFSHRVMGTKRGLLCGVIGII